MSRTHDNLTNGAVAVAGLSPCPEAAAVSELLRRVGTLERTVGGLTESLQRANDEVQLLRALVRDVQDHQLSEGIRQREADRRARATLRAHLAAHLLGVQLQCDPPHRGTPAEVLANGAVAMADTVLWAADYPPDVESGPDAPSLPEIAEEHWDAF